MYLVRIWRLDLADKPLGKFKTAPIGANKRRKSLDNMFLTKETKEKKRKHNKSDKQTKIHTPTQTGKGTQRKGEPNEHTTNNFESDL